MIPKNIIILENTHLVFIIVFSRLTFKSILIMKNVIVIGGAGYVGCKLIPALLEENYKVTVFDLMIYGNNLPADSKNLNIIKGDVRDLEN